MPEQEDRITQPEIIRLHSALSDDLAEMLSLFKIIQERLKPILASDMSTGIGSTDVETKELAPATLLGQKISDVGTSIKSTTAQMRNILARIEI